MPLSLGAAPTFPSLVGTATLISKKIPDPEWAQGAGRSSLHLKGGHTTLALEKPESWNFGGEFGEGESSLGASGKMPPPSFPRCPPLGLSQWTPPQGSDKHCSRAAMR